MKKLEIPIFERSRKYGYLYWVKSLDNSVQEFFKGSDSVDVVFDGAKLGEKVIDRKNRRISVGWRWTRALPETVSKFVLTKEKNKINIICQ